jgi:hypothetical protein
LTNMKTSPTDSRSKSTTVTDLIKKSRQYEEIGTIAAVRIEFGDGSVYSDPGLERPVSPRPAIAKRRDEHSIHS